MYMYIKMLTLGENTNSSDRGGAASKLNLRTLAKKFNFFAGQFSVKFQWGLIYIFVKYPEIQKKVKRYSGLKKLLGCSPGGR